MLTRRGWLVAGSALILGGMGRVLAMPELFVLSAGAGALVVAAGVAVRVMRPRLKATRALSPPKVHAGQESRVELTVSNAGRRRTPVVAVRDPFDHGRRHARFLVAPLRPAESASAVYHLPTERRGVFDIGPLELDVSDPFGLASVVTEVTGAATLTVYPRVDKILPLPLTRGYDPHAGADRPTALAAVGDEFYALRAYEMGDDLRRVHWPSTARLDDLMIRQLEMPWQGRATVLVDVRRSAHTDESLELAVSAAASIVTACWTSGSLVRLISTGGLDSGYGSGRAHAEAILEKLAAIGLTASDTLAPAIARLSGPGGAGALAAVVTAEAPPGEIEQLTRLRRRFGALTVVLFERSSYAGPGHVADRRSGGAAAPASRSGSSLVRVTNDAPFAPAWNRTFAGAVATRAAVPGPGRGAIR